MKWYNTPEEFTIEENRLILEVTALTDYWRKTHYGFTVDSGPFYYEIVEGDFEVSLKITGEYKAQYDQMGLMLRIDEKHWIKTGIEYVDGMQKFSAVVTNDFSSWNVIVLKENPKSIWLKAVRKADSIEIFYSLDGKNFQMTNLAYFLENKPAMVGMMAASPKGEGFTAIFEEFKIKPL